MIDTDRQEFANALAKLFSTYDRELRGDQIDVWFSLLRGYSLLTVRRAMVAYVRQGKRVPVPANLIDLCAAESSDREKSEAISDVIRRLPIKFNSGAEVMVRRLMNDHGLEKAAQIWEESYPGHGRQYVYGLV